MPVGAAPVFVPPGRTQTVPSEGAPTFPAVPSERSTGRKLEVELFVCPEPNCRQIGKRPISDVGGTVKGYCRGPIRAPHKKRKMVPILFREVRK